jgi:acetylornithine deacetylase/succinyl-diaminopimelate desuccinylase-like protein
LKQAHAVDEWVSVAELIAAAKIYALLISSLI